MALSFSQIPPSTPGEPEPLILDIPDRDLSELQTFLKLSKIGPDTWWNQHDKLAIRSLSRLDTSLSAEVSFTIQFLL